MLHATNHAKIRSSCDRYIVNVIIESEDSLITPIDAMEGHCSKFKDDEARDIFKVAFREMFLPSPKAAVR